MAREERPVSPEQVPEEVRQYMAALSQHQNQPFVQRHFFQVTWLSLAGPKHGQADFFALEFRAGQNAALIWQDGQGNWGAGQWLRLPHADADITCPPSPLSLLYFQGAQINRSLGGALELLAASKPAERTPSPVEMSSSAGRESPAASKPWWRFW